MAKKTKGKKVPAKKVAKKGTYYERNRAAVRAYQQQRRADVKAGKVVPVTEVRKNTNKKPLKPKVIGDLHSKSPEAKAIYRKRSYYNNYAETLKKQKGYDAAYAEKKRLAFIEYYNKTYPPPKSAKNEK